MRTGRFLALVLLVVAALAVGCSKGESPTRPSGVLGDWHGKIEIPGQPLDIGVTLADAGKSTIDIPTQGLRGAALKDVQVQPDRVEFALADIPGDPVFRGKLDGERITGTFTQSGQSFPLNMGRGKVAAPPRPQEPKAPFPYRVQDVTYRSGEITIAGTLTQPEGKGPFPAVLLITGSGAQNRDEELLGHKLFLLFADTLTRAGYAVLRVDDRGVGGTTGKLDDATYADLTDDAAAGVGFLRARPDIDPARVGLLGHSEGGYIAPMVAARPDSGVAFVIMMAGPAVPGYDVIIEQIKLIGTAEGQPAAEVETSVRESNQVFELLRKGDLAGAKELAKRINQSRPADKRAPEGQDDELTPYFVALVTQDPAPALSALRMPVFAFYGGKDLQVPAAQSEPAARALLAADPDATVTVFPDLNHLMQPTKTGRPSEYAGIETTIAPEVLTAVTTWLTQRFPTK
ncbi:alpha/beta hydrolase family protein [Nocardia sp. NPDC052566]|uniref:alpha/beta hydrolase family protein n=1 Tax=Nocardia sp. NPDC052566 TaxID=3364330 RepID=UPI0037C8138D